ncbi:hypothetical protein, partial [Novacetimonas hansenii]
LFLSMTCFQTLSYGGCLHRQSSENPENTKGRLKFLSSNPLEWKIFLEHSLQDIIFSKDPENA